MDEKKLQGLAVAAMTNQHGLTPAEAMSLIEEVRRLNALVARMSAERPWLGVFQWYPLDWETTDALVHKREP